MSVPHSRSGTTQAIPADNNIKKCNINDPLIIIFRNSLFTAFAIAIVLTWADALLEVMVDALDEWKTGSAKVIGAIVVTVFSMTGVLFLSFLFDFFGHRIV